MIRRIRHKRPGRSQQGTTIVETMLAAVILTVVSLGLLSVFTLAVAGNKSQGEIATRTTEYCQDKVEQFQLLLLLLLLSLIAVACPARLEWQMLYPSIRDASVAVHGPLLHATSRSIFSFPTCVFVMLAARLLLALSHGNGRRNWRGLVHALPLSGPCLTEVTIISSRGRRLHMAVFSTKR